MRLSEFLSTLAPDETFIVADIHNAFIKRHQIQLDLFEAELSATVQTTFNQAWWLVENLEELADHVSACRKNYSLRLSDGKFSNIRTFTINPEFWCGTKSDKVVATNDPKIIERLEKAQQKAFSSGVSEWLQGCDEVKRAMKNAFESYAIDLAGLKQFENDPSLWDNKSSEPEFFDVELQNRLTSEIQPPKFHNICNGVHIHHSEMYKEQHLIAQQMYNDVLAELPERVEFDIGEDLDKTSFDETGPYKWYMASDLTDCHRLQTPLEYLTTLGFDINKHKTSQLQNIRMCLEVAWKHKKFGNQSQVEEPKKSGGNFKSLEITEKGGKVFCDVSRIPKDEYKSVASKLEGIQGKWNRKLGGFVFKQGLDETIDLLKRAQNGESINIDRDYKKRTNFFPSTSQVVERVEDLVRAHVEFDNEIKCLEPSCGKADLIKPLMPYFDFDVCEFEDDMRAELENVDGLNVVGSDFLQYVPSFKYDLIVANPPFSNKRDLKHVQHMVSMLDGVLVSVVGGGFDSKYKDWISQIEKDGWIFESEDVEAGAFKESGTNVSTQIITIRKEN